MKKLYNLCLICISYLLLSLILCSFKIFAQEDDSSFYVQNKIDVFEYSIEEFLNIPAIIGTRGDERTQINSPVPIDIITAAEIRKTGFNELTSVLQRLIPYFNTSRPSIGSVSENALSSGLRGLAVDQMLVLINGKRKNGSSLMIVESLLGRGSTPIDLNTIPIDAIERIEILRDGASAQYGSDAISGIINIVLKSKSSKYVTSAYQQTSESDGKSYNTEFFIGHGSDKYSLSLTGEYRDRGATNRAGTYQNLTGLNANLNNQILMKFGDSWTRDILLNLNSKLFFDESIFCYAFANYDYRLAESGAIYRLPSNRSVLLSKFPNGFLPIYTPLIMDFWGTAGIKGSIFNWHSDLSFTFGFNSIEYKMENNLNPSLGPTSQTDFFCGKGIIKQSLMNFDFFKSFDIGLSGTLDLGLGAEVRFEKFSTEVAEENTYKVGDYIEGRSLPRGIPAFFGIAPENVLNEDRNNYAFYVDLETKIFEKTLFGLAGRFESYSDFGKTLNGKFDFRHEPFSKFMIRGSVSTGFKAPSLIQSYYNGSTAEYLETDFYGINTYKVSHPVSIALGATPLKPEKSFHITMGIASESFDNFLFSLDYFYITIKDRIVLSGNYTTSNSSIEVKNILDSNKINGARFMTNAVDTRTQGLDLNLKYNLNIINYGMIILASSINLNRTTLISIKIPDKLNNTEVDSKIFFDRRESERLISSIPKATVISSICYRWKDFEGTLRMISNSGTLFVYSAMQPEYDQFLNGKTYFDIDLSFNIYDNMLLTLGGHNLFNVYPDKLQVIPGDLLIGTVTPYSTLTPLDINGVNFYLKLKYHF